MKKHNCKCSLIAGNVVPNPECPVHVEVVPVAPSRSAAPATHCRCEFQDSNGRTVPGEPCAVHPKEAIAAPPSVNYVQEVRSDDPPPSCHVCGAVMVPTRFNCRSCGATTEPTGAAPPSEREAREMLQMAEEFLFTNYSNISGNLKILVPIVAAFGNLVARAAVPQAAAREEVLEALKAAAVIMKAIHNLPQFIWLPGYEGKTFSEHLLHIQNVILAAAVPAPGIDDTFIAAVEDQLGMGHGAWDMVAADKICKAVLVVAGATAPPKEG